MAKGGKKATKKVTRAATPVPAWDKATWRSLANIKLGVAAHVVAGALHGVPATAKLTEAEVRKAISEWGTK